PYRAGDVEPFLADPENSCGEDVDDHAFVVNCVAKHPAFRRNQRLGFCVGDHQDRVRRTDDVIFAIVGVDIGLADAEAAIGTVDQVDDVATAAADGPTAQSDANGGSSI